MGSLVYGHLFFGQSVISNLQRGKGVVTDTGDNIFGQQVGEMYTWNGALLNLVGVWKMWCSPKPAHKALDTIKPLQRQETTIDYNILSSQQVVE